MANVVPVYKKREKQTLNNYLPVCLLPIYEKVFECLIVVMELRGALFSPSSKNKKTPL